MDIHYNLKNKNLIRLDARVEHKDAGVVDSWGSHAAYFLLLACFDTPLADYKSKIGLHQIFSKMVTHYNSSFFIYRHLISFKKTWFIFMFCCMGVFLAWCMCSRVFT